jgi:hypothetical protein
MDKANNRLAVFLVPFCGEMDIQAAPVLISLLLLAVLVYCNLVDNAAAFLDMLAQG